LLEENIFIMKQEKFEKEKTVEKIILLIKENPNVTQKELVKKTGLTRRGIEWNLAKLKQEKIIKRVGSDKAGHWEIIKK